MRPSLQEVLERELGASVRGQRPLAGGDINQAFEVELESGDRLFVKTHPAPPEGMFAAEAHGLEWLREANALRLPRVLAVSDERPAFLALELLSPGPQVSAYDEELGRGLAALHAAAPSAFGLDRDNFIGRLGQRNRPADDWPSFYWRERLEPQLVLATDKGLISESLARSFETLERSLPDLVGPAEPPARLHGDLWGGNLHTDERGRPCLIDPAVYGGHREIDLAMMRLFGGFSPMVFGAYEEAWPLAAGATDRVPLYQLYPILVHVNLFGGGYVGSLRRALAACV